MRNVLSHVHKHQRKRDRIERPPTNMEEWDMMHVSNEDDK